VRRASGPEGFSKLSELESPDTAPLKPRRRTRPRAFQPESMGAIGEQAFILEALAHSIVGAARRGEAMSVFEDCRRAEDVLSELSGLMEELGLTPGERP
jgi:hypothetical protein